MKLPIVQQLNRQDFPEAPAWISKVLYPIQLFFTIVYGALNKQLTLQDNLSCTIKQFSVVAGPLDTDNTFSFPIDLKRIPVELNAYCTNADGNYAPVYPQVSWNYVNNQIVINGIKGLTDTLKYNFTVTVK